MADGVLSDPEIAELISVAKRLPNNWQSNTISRDGQIQVQFDIYGVDGTLFRIIIRQSIRNLNDFSVILAISPTGMRQINLLRYDGSSHPHRNKIEGNRIDLMPHIHIATERYQRLRRADAEEYAEETDRYNDINRAWECFRADTNLQPLKGGAEMNLPKPFTEV